MQNIQAVRTGLPSIADDLARQGWSVKEGYFTPDLCAGLLADLRMQEEAGKLTPAGIGRNLAQQVKAGIRNDHTLWLTGRTDAPRQFLSRMEELRLELNRELFLGLFEYEAHYALYPPGGFYKKHLDSFRGAKNRVVSTVSYLTPGWREEDGGHLVLYHPENDALSIQKITPCAGTLAVFLSEEIPHEVLPPVRERASIAGWFRCNVSTAARADPPR